MSSSERICTLITTIGDGPSPPRKEPRRSRGGREKVWRSRPSSAKVASAPAFASSSACFLHALAHSAPDSQSTFAMYLVWGFSLRLYAMLSDPGSPRTHHSPTVFLYLSCSFFLWAQTSS